MRAVVYERFGEPGEVLEVRKVQPLVPGDGEVLVRMLASPVNPSDLMAIRGKYGMLPKLPATPGFEGVGIVKSAGAGLLGRFLVGKQVAVLGSKTGNWQDEAIVMAKQAVPVSKLPVEQAAMFFVNPTSAYAMTRRVLCVPPDQWLAQTAAGSALGKMVIRLGKRFGFKTLNIVRRSQQIDELRALGGDAVIATDNDGWVDELRRAVGNQGVHYAIDAVGGEVASKLIGCLGVGGRMLLYGTLSGEPLSFLSRDLLTPTASVEGFWLARWMPKLGLLQKLGLVRKVGKLIAEGVLASEVGKSYPLEQVCQAVVEAERAARGGKVLLRMDQ